MNAFFNARQRKPPKNENENITMKAHKHDIEQIGNKTNHDN
jgi:hypothetical protein